MNRATVYLKQTLTPAQFAEWRRQGALDTRDSQARRHWAWLARMQDYPQTHAEVQTRTRAWLRKWGYMAADGTRLGPEPDARGR